MNRCRAPLCHGAPPPPRMNARALQLAVGAAAVTAGHFCVRAAFCRCTEPRRPWLSHVGCAGGRAPLECLCCRARRPALAARAAWPRRLRLRPMSATDGAVSTDATQSSRGAGRCLPVAADAEEEEALTRRHRHHGLRQVQGRRREPHAAVCESATILSQGQPPAGARRGRSMHCDGGRGARLHGHDISISRYLYLSIYIYIRSIHRCFSLSLHLSISPSLSLSLSLSLHLSKNTMDRSQRKAAWMSWR